MYQEVSTRKRIEMTDVVPLTELKKRGS